MSKPLRLLSDMMAFSSLDFSSASDTAAIYAVVHGWGCDDAETDPTHRCDDIVCSQAGWASVARKHDWSNERVDLLKEAHAQFRALRADE